MGDPRKFVLIGESRAAIALARLIPVNCQPEDKVEISLGLFTFNSTFHHGFSADSLADQDPRSRSLLVALLD